MMELLILARILLNIIGYRRYNFFTSLIYGITEPILGFFRELLYRIGLNRGMIDFSPLIAMMAFRLIERILRGVLF